MAKHKVAWTVAFLRGKKEKATKQQDDCEVAELDQSDWEARVSQTPMAGVETVSLLDPKDVK
eukprot:2779925-Alexandrium_andersonii.AAC.1